MRRKRQLTDREWKWLWEYTRTGSNASQAARIAYGGTPISVRVKGHKKKVKLKPILDKIDKIWDGLLEIGPDRWEWKKTGDEVDREVDAYLQRLKRRIRKSL
jgi:predicted transcriptional regulator of viral defense system